MPSFGSQTDITFVDGSHKLIALLNCLDRHLSDDIREESLKACRHIVQELLGYANSTVFVYKSEANSKTADPTEVEFTLTQESEQVLDRNLHHTSDRAESPVSVNGYSSDLSDLDISSGEDLSDLLPALSATEPNILKYHGERSYHLPEITQIKGSDSKVKFCEFCGSDVTVQDSDLDSNDSDSQSEVTEEVTYCCHAQRRLCALAAKYSKKFTEALKKKGISKIDISPGKTLLKEEAEKRAHARLLVKKRQRELRLLGIGGAPSLQSSSFHSFARQTKIINFSLSEPTNTQSSWIAEQKEEDDATILWRQQVEGNSKLRDKRDKQKKQRRKKVNRCKSEDEDELLAWMKKQDKKTTLKTPLCLQQYGNGNAFKLLLHDNTGQCYYPSGDVAILITAMSPGIYSYFVLSLSVSGVQNVLAYFDDLGRGFCLYKESLNQRLTYEVQGGTFFNEKGGIRKKWLWEDESSFIQPLVLNFNSFITLKVTSQDCMLLTITGNQHCATRFPVGRKLTPPALQAVLDCPYNEYLKAAKSNINTLLEKIQTSSKAFSRSFIRKGSNEKSSTIKVTPGPVNAVSLPPLKNGKALIDKSPKRVTF